jgi:enterochelin esterase-like enzyme
MRTYFLFLLVLLSSFVFARESKLNENGIIKSSILKEDVKYSIYLPADYETSDRKYPVLYLLHGLSDDHTGWPQFGEVKYIADKAIREGEATPMIIVMPDAKRTYYVNDVEGKYRYEDFFIKELIPYIESNYKCRTTSEYRAVAGLSMGGYGSLLYSLHHPEMFAACYAMSSATRTDEEVINMSNDSYDAVYTPLFGAHKGKDRINDYYNSNSILYLAAHIPEAQKNKVRFYIDCGDDDFLYKGNSTLHILMRDLNIPHEYRVRQGGHEWEYWRTGLQNALPFISKSFHR